MAPEAVPPFVVKFIKAVVIFFFEPIAESLLTKVAMTFATVFVGNMPHLNCRMVFVSLSEQGAYISYLFSING